MWRGNTDWRASARLIAGAITAMALLSAMHGSAEAAAPATKPKVIQVCHGFGCTFRSRLTLTATDGARFRSIMRAGAASPRAERAAISRAVQYFERRTRDATGFTDRPKADFGKPERGQMDCIDEATNTRALLVYLSERGMLKHHKVGRNVTRGFLFDGRYPHWTAIVSDPAGKRWVVDSWYAPMGGAPDIFPYEEWKVRGQWESGELN